ncbi:hypothetical protein HMPREF1603_04053, partial [Escherichia coli 907892]
MSLTQSSHHTSFPQRQPEQGWRFHLSAKGISIMSEITASRPEVVNGHTDVICSTSIR